MTNQFPDNNRGGSDAFTDDKEFLDARAENLRLRIKAKIQEESRGYQGDVMIHSNSLGGTVRHANVAVGIDGFNRPVKPDGYSHEGVLMAELAEHGSVLVVLNGAEPRGSNIHYQFLAMMISGDTNNVGYAQYIHDYEPEEYRDVLDMEAIPKICVLADNTIVVDFDDTFLHYMYRCGEPLSPALLHQKVTQMEAVMVEQGMIDE